jgi:hypothetical protein
MPEASPTLCLCSGDDLRRISELQLLMAQSNQLSKRLSNLAELAKQIESVGKDANHEIRRMQDQRAALASQLRSALKDDARYFSNVNLINDRLTATVNSIGDQLWPWSILELPTMVEGINQIPTSDTSGQIGTAGLFQGTGAWGGTLEGWSTEQQWWVHTWTCTAVLPPARGQGTFSYRFGASCDAMVYRTDGAVSLTSYITVGTTSDVSTPITNWQTVYWPFNVFFTSPEPTFEDSGGGPVIGSINVVGGQTAAITVIFGVVVSISEGLVMFLPDSVFGMGLLGQSGSAAWGKIQYRFNPLWVNEGAAEAIQ